MPVMYHGPDLNRKSAAGYRQLVLFSLEPHDHQRQKCPCSIGHHIAHIETAIYNEVFLYKLHTQSIAGYKYGYNQ